MRGLSIAGRMGSGKDYLFAIIQSVYPNAVPVKVSTFVVKEALRLGLIPNNVVDKKRDREVMQRLGGENPGGRFQTATATMCGLLIAEGKLPVVCDIRTVLDEDMNRKLGFPLVVVTAPQELRVERVMARDGTSRDEVMRYINHGVTESFVDELEVDHTFQNDGKHTARELSRLFRFIADCELGGRIGQRKLYF